LALQDPAVAARAATTSLGECRSDVTDYFLAACFLCQCASQSREEVAAGKYAEQALGCLRQALERGYKDKQQRELMKKHHDLQILRKRMPRQFDQVLTVGL
jgi:hypothetical protein